ncbi:MAG: BrxA/BrxB family bacilliredoxin [Candidatus Hydrogenedentes bacterium]|nr:BrxA/BrxB family bacilliredoxin [Candidatus Hydrogenedentota bacterium]
MPPLYDPEQVRPMWEELARVGITPVTTPGGVDEAIGNNEGTVLCVINSVCGCAAGNARPGVCLALQSDVIPDVMITVFAGMDTEATARARSYMPDVAPSSPCIALFKNGKPLRVFERRHIEDMTAVEIANQLQAVFREHCTRRGPSVPREVYEANEPARVCGSTLSPYTA